LGGFAHAKDGMLRIKRWLLAHEGLSNCDKVN
jgi:hypothetical protein